jgi:antitoxin VapB
MYIRNVYTERAMGKEYKAKVFKSGNSLALRLPKDLGLKEGSTMVLREDPSGYHFEPEEAPKRRLDVDSFWGKAKHLQVPERRDFDQRPSTIAARKAKESE